MFDFTLIGRSIADAAAGSSRSPHGAPAASEAEAALEGGFGQALESLAGFELEAGDAAATPDGEAADDAIVDPFVVSQAEADDDDEAGETSLVASALTFEAAQSGATPDLTTAARTPASIAPVADSTFAGDAAAADPLTADAPAPGAGASAHREAPTGHATAAKGDMTANAAPQTAAAATFANEHQAVAANTAAPMAQHDEAAPAAPAPSTETVEGRPARAHAEDRARADRPAAPARPVAFTTDPASPIAGAVDDGRHAAATIQQAAAATTRSRTAAEVARIVDRLKAAVDAAGSTGDTPAAAPARTFTAPVATADVAAGSAPVPTDAAAAPHATSAVGLTSSSSDAHRSGGQDASDLSHHFGGASSLMAPRPAAAAVAPVATAFASLVDAPGTLPAETTAQIVQAIRMQFGREGSEAHIKLDPRQFGDMAVRIRVERGQVVASVEADAPVVREWLQSNQHLLRQSLAGQQLTLDRLDVSEPPSSTDRQREREDHQGDREEASRQQQRRRRPETSELFDVVA